MLDIALKDFIECDIKDIDDFSDLKKSKVEYEYIIDRKFILTLDKRDVTVTRKSDGATKMITNDDIDAVARATGVEWLDDFQPTGLYFDGDDIYVVCRDWGWGYALFAVYRFDFETEDISFVGWRKVIDADKTKMFIIPSNS
jgi:hypothetical protein